MSLDLTDSSEQLYRANRTYRYALFVVSVFIAVTILDLIVADILPERGALVRWLSLGASVFLACVFIFVLWGVFLALSPGVQSVEITEQALVLRYRAGKANVIRWTDPRFRIRLEVFTPGPGDSGSPSPSQTVSLWGPWLRYSRVNESVLEGLVSASEVRGLQIRRRILSGGDGSTTKILITHPS